jgi:hypothetical protein
MRVYIDIVLAVLNWAGTRIWTVDGKKHESYLHLHYCNFNVKILDEGCFLSPIKVQISS